MVSVEKFKSSYVALQALELFTKWVGQIWSLLSQLINDKLLAWVDWPGTARESQDRHHAWLSFQATSTLRVDETTKAWQDAPLACVARVSKNCSPDGRVKFKWMENGSIENKILASRLALRALGFSSWPFNDVRPLPKRSASNGLPPNRLFDGQAVKPSLDHALHDETRLLTAITPLAMARLRAQGALASLKRLVLNQVNGFDDTPATHATRQLAHFSASMWATGSGSNKPFFSRR